MKFDICLMNPPYDGILHMKFLEKCLQYISENGKVVQVSPNIFIKARCLTKESSYKELFRGVLESIEILSHDEANRLFNLGNSINELAIYKINKNTDTPIDIENLGFESSIEKSIFHKILQKRKDKLGWENKNTKRHGEQKGYYVNLYTWHVGTNAYNTCINDTDKFSRTVYFDSEKQKRNFINSFKTDFMEYYVREIVWAGAGITDKCFMLEKHYYNNPITDKTFFDFFELNKDEQEFILNKVKSYDK